MSSPIAFESPQACARRLSAAVDDVFLPLQALAAALGRLCAGPTAPCAAALHGLRPQIDALLRGAEACAGAGVVLAPGALADRLLYMEWRRRLGADRLLSLQLNLDQRSANCFHYLDAPWFRIPRERGARTVAGPYVDLHCTGEYALTFSLPVTVAGRFVGVACADLPVQRFEPQLLRVLLRLRQEALLVSAEGRVIASSSPDWAAGDLLAGRLDARACSVLPLAAEAGGWSLWCLPAERRLAA